jgi:Tol biopolymer transport system component
VAIVEADSNRILQIKIRSLEFGTITQLTAFGPNPLNIQPVSYDPTWSPRGDLIAYVTNNTGNDEIFVTNLDGSVHTQLTFNATEWDKHPTWSPDGAQIAFYSNRETALRRLWIMNVDGSNQRNLSALIQPAPGNTSYEDWDPIWVR